MHFALNWARPPRRPTHFMKNISVNSRRFPNISRATKGFRAQARLHRDALRSTPTISGDEIITSVRACTGRAHGYQCANPRTRKRISSSSRWVCVDDMLTKEKAQEDAYLLLQVHDELVYEFRNARVEDLGYENKRDYGICIVQPRRRARCRLS